MDKIRPFALSEIWMTGHSHKHPSRGKIHKDWRVWLVFLLMLAAIFMYVLSLDDAIIPR